MPKKGEQMSHENTSGVSDYLSAHYKTRVRQSQENFV